MELFNLTNAIKINHLNMTHHDYNKFFDDVEIFLNGYLNFLIELFKQMEIDYEFHSLGFRISRCL
jgi:hypothetical protein